MKMRPTLPLVLACALGASACGSSGSTTHPARHRGPGRPLRSYHVRLTAAAVNPKGAPRASGAVVVALHHRAIVCFRFAHLRGVTSPTTAEIGQGPAGKSGRAVLVLSRGPTLRRKGCVRAPHALPAQLERRPGAYYVVVNSHAYPRGAIRGQLANS